MFTQSQLENAYISPVTFFGTCPASSNKTLVSQKIAFPFIVEKTIASFALGTDRTMDLRFFVSPDDDEPLTHQPNGINILAYYGQTDYLTGDDEQKVIEHYIPVHERNQRLKIHATNHDSFDHSIDVTFLIKIIPKE